MGLLDEIERWPVAHVAAATAGPGPGAETAGDIDRPFALASVTKLLTAMAVLVAHEEGTVDLDEAVTAEGATVADLLAHTGGVAPEHRAAMAPPHTRRIYSTAAYEIVADVIAERSAMTFSTYATEAVCAPLAMTATELPGSAGAGGRSTVRDLLRLAESWRAPLLVDTSTLARACRPHLPALAGVLPGFGRQEPNPWGLGPEIRGDKHPHWTGTTNAPETFGHFGQTGTMLWVDPVADRVLVALSDEPFGPWAAAAWPRLSDTVLSHGPNASSG